MPTKSNPKQDWGYYASTPRIVRTHYKQLSHTEKWLYVCLKDLCGDKGTCFRSLRTLAEETDLSIGNLSTGIRHLHEAGLIHAEKKRRSNNPTAKEVWHISIVDIWQANADYCSKNEHSDNNVQNLNNNVQELNNNVHFLNDPPLERSKNEQQCSNFETEERTVKDTILEERTMEEKIVGSACATPTPPLAPVLEAQKEDDLTTKETNTDDGLATLSAGHDSRDDSQHRLSGSDQAELGRTPPVAPKGRQQKDPPVKRASRPRAQASPQASSPSRKPPAPAPAAEDTALSERCQAIQAKIDELRGFALKRAGLIIDERKVIRDHLAREDFTDERIERIHSWIVTNIWKYKSVGGRGDVGARVIWEESGRAEALTVAPLPNRPARPRYNEHGVDMNEYSLASLMARQARRQEVGQA